MNRISGVLITKDEELSLGRCIRSIEGVDEVVILDTGSSDRTIEIAKASGAKVFSSDPIVPFHFAEARNRATALASHDWILSIDADEALRPGSVGKIRKAVQSAGEVTAFLTTFVNRPEGSHDRTTSIRKIKIFRRSVWTWKYRVHEQLMPLSPPGVVGDLSPAVIEHLPPPDKAKRHGQNVELLKLCIEENPEYARAWRHLGQELMLRRMWLEAVPYLAEYVDRTDEGALEKSEAMMRIGQCHAEIGQMDEALKWFDFSASADPRRRESLYQAAWHLIRTARTVADLEKAKSYVLKLLEIPVSSKPQSHHDFPAAWGHEPRKMLAFCRDEIAKASTVAHP